MNAWAAALLAVAMLVSPPRRRLVARRRPVGLRATGKWPGAVLGVFVLGAAAVLAGPALTVASGLLAATAAVRLRRHRRTRDARRDGQALATALETLVGELRVGSHPVHGLTVAAAESTGDTAAALGALAARAKLGADVGAGLRSTASSSSVPRYWTRIAICWQLALDHGLPVALLLRAACQDIVHRQRFVDRVEAGLSGARATAAILAALPLLGVLLGQLVGAQPVRFLLGPGGWVLVIGVTLQCAGILWSDRITGRVIW